ncbi:hypothetical protein BH23BAC1_BH23BAC1_17860 [soil metagenome]
MEKIEAIKELFGSLSDSDKKVVLEYILIETQSRDNKSSKGIFIGPVPSSERLICEKCGKLYRKESKD